MCCATGVCARRCALFSLFFFLSFIWISFYYDVVHAHTGPPIKSIPIMKAFLLALHSTAWRRKAWCAVNNPCHILVGYIFNFSTMKSTEHPNLLQNPEMGPFFNLNKNFNKKNCYKPIAATVTSTLTLSAMIPCWTLPCEQQWWHVVVFVQNSNTKPSFQNNTTLLPTVPPAVRQTSEQYVRTRVYVFAIRTVLFEIVASVCMVIRILAGCVIGFIMKKRRKSYMSHQSKLA